MRLHDNCLFDAQAEKGLTSLPANMSGLGSLPETRSSQAFKMTSEPAFLTSVSRLDSRTFSPSTAARQTSRTTHCSTKPPAPGPAPAPSLSGHDSFAPQTPREARVQLMAPKYWGNPRASLIRPLVDDSEDIWLVERTYFWFGFDVGARCTIIRYQAQLFVYSPLPLTPSLKKSIDDLGLVSVVVAPNNEHVDFVKSWHMQYPEAAYLGPTGCVESKPQLPFTASTFGDDPQNPVPHDSLAHFQPVLTSLFVPGAPFFNESLFIHLPTHSLLTCDFIWNYPPRRLAEREGLDLPLKTSVWAFAMNRVYAPVYNRLLVRDREAFRSFWAKLREASISVIVPCHGLVVEDGAEGVLDHWLPSFLTDGA